jgi:DivIVA domain-containing protein
MSAEHRAAPPTAARIPRCAPGARGYDVGQVDALLGAVQEALDGSGPEARTAALLSTHVRSAVFTAAGGGYRPEAVDEILDAAEDALAAAEREQVLRTRGPAAWQEHVAALTEVVRGRIERPRTQRFRRPSRSRARGYSAAHVDVLCERLGARLEGSAPLEPAELRRAVLPPAHGELSYEEQQVDAFLDRSVQLLLAMR